ncbi:MAG: response regulator [Scytolyngbya sp. HA4215-MV1]|jgi:CheY-like chemotaxis protein|nr:response regulator [Scytolyngbya sp. HA4215-MV1]
MTLGKSQASTGEILVVDDMPDNLRLLSSLLSGQGYKVRKVTNGKWAIQAALLSPPELILLDVMMPGMNGYEVCRHLKAHPETRDVPIIFLSVNDEVLDKVQAFRVGGIDYVTKPFEPAEILVRVETQLQLGRLQKQVQAQNLQLQKQMGDRSLPALPACAPASFPTAEFTDHSTVVEKRAQPIEPVAENDALLQLNRQLQIALEQAEHTSGLKSDLMFALYQEFYPLLAAISGVTQVLQSDQAQTSLGVEGMCHLQQMGDRCTRIQHLLEDVLRLIQTTASTLPSPAEPQPIEELLKENE